MKTSTELLKDVNAYLAGITDRRMPESLYAPIKYVLSMGGKRLRPVLMLLAYNMYRDDTEKIIPVACGLETYHNYTLLHDDLMDKADVRRGKQTVHKRWDDNTAILSGDSMLVMAYEHIAKCDENKLGSVLAMFTKTALEIGEGQQYDMDFEKRNDVAEEEYIEMIRLKTSVLLACALKTGAILAGAPEEDADALYKFGECVGLAFQLQDDLLDVYGDPKVFGKKIGGDILCNKKTYMLINAYNKADEGQRAELMKWIEAEDYVPEEKIAAVTDLYNKIGVARIAGDKIRSYFDESRQYLDRLNVSDERKSELRAYTEAMVNREV